MAYNEKKPCYTEKEVTPMATMDDIARRLGISKSTVSKAFSGAGDISEAMRRAVLETAEVPFRLERRTALWSGVHFLLTAAVFSLAGWQCRWFPYRETWLCLLGLLLLCYLLMWAVRYVGWRQDVRAIRKGVGLPEEPEQPDCRKAAPYALLAAAVELLLPWLLRLLDARDVPVLTGIFYPFLILPLFCFFSSWSLAKRCRQLWLAYPVLCGVLTLPCVFLLYNSSALFHVWVAVIAALTGGLFGALWKKSRK